MEKQLKRNSSGIAERRNWQRSGLQQLRESSSLVAGEPDLKACKEEQRRRGQKQQAPQVLTQQDHMPVRHLQVHKGGTPKTTCCLVILSTSVQGSVTASNPVQ
jgi:hypothetical protein